MPPSSLRPSTSEAPRWGHPSSITPTRPSVSRKAMRFSPSRRTRIGSQSGSGAGEQLVLFAGKHGRLLLAGDLPLKDVPRVRGVGVVAERAADAIADEHHVRR